MNLSDLRTKPEQRHNNNQICNLLETMKNQMSEAARRKAREYQRLWRQRNPDKVRQNTINYWERKANELNKQGLSLRDIGKKLNISHMKVKRLLQACNTL